MSNNAVDIGMDIKPEALRRYVMVESIELVANREEASKNTGSIPIEVRMTGQPKSYTIAKDAPFGGREVFTWRLTWLKPEDAAIVEEKGWHGVPAERIGYALGKGGKYRSDFDVLHRACNSKKGWLAAGADGKLTSALVGHIVAFEVENRVIAKQEYEPFLAVPVDIADDYVFPADRDMFVAQGPVGVRKAKGESAVPVVATGTGPTADQLAVAAQIAGIIGKPIDMVNDEDFAAGLIMKNRAKAPVLINPSVQKAADEGRLGSYLVDIGAVQEVDGVLQEVA